MHEFVIFPTGNDLKDVTKGYDETRGFPNCGGTIDGTHISGPSEAHGDYLNHKRYNSLTVQAVCFDKHVFRDFNMFNIGWRVEFMMSKFLQILNYSVFHRGENSLLFPNWMRTKFLFIKQ